MEKNSSQCLQVDLNEKSFQSHVCQYTCTQKVSLFKHIHSVHDTEMEDTNDTSEVNDDKEIMKNVIQDERKDYKCDNCGKSFVHKYSLKTHVETIHEKSKSFKCNVCNKNFTQKGNLVKHIASVHA